MAGNSPSRIAPGYARAVGILSESLACALSEDARIDAGWIAGIRKGWKREAAKAKRYSGRVGDAKSIDFGALQRSAKGAIPALRSVQEYIRALRADLLTNKGFWTTEIDSPGTVSLQAMKAKAVAELDAAESAIGDGIYRVEFSSKVLTPGSGEYQLDGGMRRREAEGSLRGFQLYLNGIELSTDEAVDAADKAVSVRLLSHLTKVAKFAGGTIDFGSYEPDVVQLGRVRVVFADAPPSGMSPVDPAFRRAGPGQEPRHLSARRGHIGRIKQAGEMLKRAGLDHLWYGEIVVMCAKCGGENQYGPRFTTGAHYHRKGDRVTVYEVSPRLIAHELGHRHWYKFMDASERASFSKWFGQVKATSEYGTVASEEDFAEVFADYVDRKDLTRDQLDRLKAFLSGKRKLEGVVSASMESALVEAKTAIYSRMEPLFVAVIEPLRRLLSPWKRSTPEEAEGAVKRLRAACEALLAELTIESENKAIERYLKKHAATIRNLRKLLRAMADAKDWDAMRVVFAANQTKSKTVLDKFGEYRMHVMGLISAFDAEVEGSFNIGGFRVVLVSAGYGDWSDALVVRLRSVLEDASERLRRVGMGEVAKGSVYAYPIDTLPPSVGRAHTALASYNSARDTVSVAAVGDDRARSVRTLVHELGHRAYFKVLDGRSRTAWSEFFEAGNGVPDVDGMIRRWEGYVSNPPDRDASQYGRYLGYYASHLKKSGEDRELMFLGLVADNVGIGEKFDPYVGRPKKGVTPGLDQLIAKRNEVRVFLHPVTAYSGTNAEELFAEAFADYVMHGPRKIPEIVRIALKRTLPSLRERIAEAIMLRRDIPTGVGALAAGELLSKLIGKVSVYVYRWVPDYADSVIRPGDHVLLDPDEGQHYGGKRGRRLTALVPARDLEYRQGDEYAYRGAARRAASAPRTLPSLREERLGEAVSESVGGLASALSEAASEMTDAEVMDAVGAAKRYRQRLVTAAERKLYRERDRLFGSFRGGTDAEIAARHNALKRVQADADAEIAKAQAAYARKLDAIRVKAGEWADLVPSSALVRERSNFSQEARQSFASLGSALLDALA